MEAHIGENMQNILKIKDYTNAATKGQILMKFYVVANHYLVSLNLKFHEDRCTNARARVVNAHVHVLSQVCAFTTPPITLISH